LKKKVKSNMQLIFTVAAKAADGAFVVGAVEGLGLLPAALKADAATDGAIVKAMKTADFKAKRGTVLDLLAPRGLAASRILVVGLGRQETFDALAAEQLAAAALKPLDGATDADVTFAIDCPNESLVDAAGLAAHLALGLRLKGYRFDRYRTKEPEPGLALKKAVVVTPAVAAAKKAWQRLEPVANGIALARDLVNEPANVLSPVEFAKRIRALSKFGLKVEVLGEAQMKTLGMGALLGVGQGSVRESQVVVMQWNGGKAGARPLAFVGKGLCFDSGGLSLKSGSNMMNMKGDMGGAAAVAGAMLALAGRKAKVNAVGVAALVENMPDGGAQRPDDVVKTMSGQTVEVLNTDAEGRLVLADALWYAQNRFKPAAMVDLATLTGAMVVALGTEYAGVFSNDDPLAQRLLAAGQAVGEPLWRMPLSTEYDKLLKSKIADMKNIGGAYAGAITAAQFLQRFVNATPWAHLDIAGVAYQERDYKPLVPSWATGWGVRILDQLAGG
jgi:leucyl aminopeptidase